MQSTPAATSSSPLFDSTAAGRRHWRMFKDRSARYLVGIGGVGVLIAILLIFFYLVFVVIPLFAGAEMHVAQRFAVPGGGTTAHLALEEQTEIGIRYTHDGRIVFFRTDNGAVIANESLPLQKKTNVASVAMGAPGSQFAAFGLSNGTAFATKTAFAATFAETTRTLTPRVEFPAGNTPITVDPLGHPLMHLAAQIEGERMTLAAATDDQRLLLTTFEREEAMLGEEGELRPVTRELARMAEPVARLLLDPEQRRLYVADHAGTLMVYNIANPANAAVLQRINVVESGARVTALELLSGGVSLLVGLSDGTVAQWFAVRDDHGNQLLTRIRAFRERNAAITHIAPEFFRKGFVTADASGYLGLFHSTAERTLLLTPGASTPLQHVSFSPRANALLTEDSTGQIALWRIENEHPEVSWSSLWGHVWYEGYDEPQWQWQSSASTNTFEPKFSLTPLAFGTFKAAIYALIFAVPLALFGAIYTAHFMSPRMRGIVKPTVEVMGAVPTVVLGFLAGLWLAPFVEKHLPGVFSALIILPFGVLAFAYVWQKLPLSLRSRIPEGWYAALLMPVVLALGWVALELSPTMETWWFGGDMRLWLSNEMGITFDQRNSIIVGLAMGFAVTPTIFTIAEDAIFSVPGHLVRGSLALGATPWQTLWRVVLLTASPGIFSAIMIGLGRAVGETMIVLMATGNTPVMDLSMFQGMRTLSANIAVEMPESEVGSTHYRVLFLAALVLFLFTFVFNTLAEVVRQRLRRKYSSL